MTFAPQPKPAPGGRKREKARVSRAEQTWLHKLRVYCTARDGYCRVPGCIITSRASHLCHLWTWKRAKTVSQDIGDRHPTFACIMMCGYHHDLEDGRDGDGIRLVVDPLSDDYADGPLLFTLDGEDIGRSEPRQAKGPVRERS